MTDYTDLEAAATYAAHDIIKFSDESEEMRALQQFHEEVDPETILALIADLDQARNGMRHSCAIRLKREIERLKAENEALRKALSDVREALGREYWDQYAGLDDTREILDAAMSKEVQS